jgi:cytochrome c-type biogenesis protein
MFSETISYSAAFAAGLLSFFSPCIFPLIPGYFSFITGFSLERLTADYDNKIKMKVLLSAVFFVLGFSAVFIMMGASASFVGGIVFEHRSLIRIAGGLIVIVMGIHLTGLFRIKSLEVEKRFHVIKSPLNYFGGFLVGMAFGAGWSPCIGPLLGSILIFAGSRETVSEGVLLLGVYSAGLAIPFVVISFFVNYIITFIKKVSFVLKYVNAAAGILLIIVGILLIADRI